MALGNAKGRAKLSDLVCRQVLGCNVGLRCVSGFPQKWNLRFSDLSRSSNSSKGGRELKEREQFTTSTEPMLCEKADIHVFSQFLEAIQCYDELQSVVQHDN